MACNKPTIPKGTCCISVGYGGYGAKYQRITKIIKAII